MGLESLAGGAFLGYLVGKVVDGKPQVSIVKSNPGLIVSGPSSESLANQSTAELLSRIASYVKPSDTEGYIFSQSMTMFDDVAHAFSPKGNKILLADVIIQVETNDMLFGSETSQDVTIKAGELAGFTRVDLQYLFFKNKVSGSNGTVRILGVVK